MPHKYLLDENVDFADLNQLHIKVPNLIVKAVGEPGYPPKRTPDPDILCWCEENNFLLVTNNRASMPVHLADHIASGRHVPGIILLNPNLSIGDNLEELILIAECSFEGEYQDEIKFLPL